jgi:tetratricopeptide (TPR) repeat protein
MATVYLARDLKHSRSVAIKVLHPELAAALGSERFLREIQLTANLQHPHILPLYDSGEAAGLLYYVMPLVEGESLRDRLDRDKQLPLEDALTIARHVAAALEHAHQRRIIHRDIKPENILLSAGEAVVADFGIARAVSAAGGEKLTETGLAVGTPAYMSPEQAAGERDLDGRSDIYALGCVLYEMLAGEPPFTGPTAQAILAKRLSEPVPHLGTLRDVPPALERAVTRALAKAPVDRFATATQFSAALSLPAAEGSTLEVRKTPRRLRLRSAAFLLGVLAVTGVAAAYLISRRNSGRALDANLIAVAPFDILGGDQIWHEGLVDLLARTLDGLAPFRTVPQTLTLRHWSGSADSLSARRLGQLTGAGLAVYGQLAGIGKDSVRLSATLLDVATGRVRAEFERSGPGDRIAELADSFSIAALRQLGGKSRPSGARLSSVGTRSLPALKAFLHGEQYFRRTLFDSAIADYNHALALDTAFALAMRRLELARAWGGEGDVVTNWSYVRAGQFNHGLAPRDSFLLVADSLDGAAEQPLQRSWLPLERRRLATLQEAAHRYPEDPEIWYQLGEVRYHYGIDLGGTPLEALEAFDHAIALDSSFGPAYLHPVYDLAPMVGDSARTGRYLAAAEHVTGWQQSHPGVTLTRLLLQPDGHSTDVVQRIIDTASSPVLKDAISPLRFFSDSSETAVRLARRNFENMNSAGEAVDDSLERITFLALSLARRGHLREAYRVVGHRTAYVLPSIPLAAAQFGIVPGDTAAALFRDWAERKDIGLGTVGFEWWIARGDSVAIKRVRWRGDSLMRSGADSGAKDWGIAIVARAEVALSLARHDTVEASRQIQALPGRSLYHHFDFERVMLQPLLLSSQRRDREAAALLQWRASGFFGVFHELERGRVAERLGDRKTAVEAYTYVAVLWRNADPELQPYVAEARAGLARLTGEPRR